MRTRMRETTQEMAEKAAAVIGPSLTKKLERVSPEERIDVLLKLVCSLSCMITAQRHGEDEKAVFYAKAGSFAGGLLSDLLPLPRGEDYEVHFGEGMEEKLESDPELKAFVQGVVADIRQALDGARTGKFASVEEAMDSTGGRRLDPEEIEDVFGTDDPANKRKLQ